MASATLRGRVLLSYRTLLMAQRDLFRNDVRAVVAARDKTRDGYEANSGVSDEKQIEELIKVARDTATFVAEGIMQAEQKPEEDTFVLNIRDTTHQSMDSPQQIHSDAERYRSLNELNPPAQRCGGGGGGGQ